MSLPDLKTIQTREILAFRLFADSDQCPVPKTESNCRDLWQSANEDTRKEWRTHAESHMANLDKVGLGVRISDSSKVAKHLDWLVTVPPRAAYSLPSASSEPPTIQLPNPSGFP
jgi:hypothetical protein